MSEQVYSHEEVLWIEISMRRIQDDALGRYIHDPGNLDNIIKQFRKAYRHLREIKTDPTLQCPPGYTHKYCACTTDIRHSGRPAVGA
ncbi:MAG: hypothetical protein EHM35_13275 [Planctomycetaceae bacterium]|nr:MAG: hypothetical protein EHM35_13275 [Planctomycetaceae bacterium]